VKSKFRRISILDGSQATQQDQGCGTHRRESRHTEETAAQFFEELFKLAVKEAKGAAGKFVIPGIGRVVKAHRKARMGRNPQTGEAIKIKAKTVVRLRPSKAFKDAILK